MSKTFVVAELSANYGYRLDVAVAAVALGATLVEKHFILDQLIGGPDAAFSMKKDEFAVMENFIRSVEKALGEVVYSTAPTKIKRREFSRFL